MQDAEVRDNHNQNPADFSFVSHDKVQSRVEHQSLPSHHAPPTDADNDAGNVRIRPDVEVEHDEAQRMDGTSPRAKKQTPEVKTGVPLESHPYSKLKLNGVDPCDGCEGCYHHRRG